MVITMKKNSHNNKKSLKLIERMKRRQEVEKLIINSLKEENDLTIAELVIKSGLSRGNFNHYLRNLVKRKLIIKNRQKDIHGRPTFLRLNKKKLEELEQMAHNNYKSFEEFNLKNIYAMKILEEIDKQQTQEKQHQELIRLFKQFNKEGFGARIIFLLHSDYIKIDYNLSLTEKGKKALKKLEKTEKKKKSNS